MATNALASYNFPDAYYTNLIASATSVKYVSASGSDSNNGNTVTTPYLTIAKALTDTSAIATITADPNDTTGQLGSAIVTLEGQYGTLRSYYNNTNNVKR